ncbi:hypothetical protein JZU51_00865, partial [bacterium]|nr:hypothetical protein [bacterium]
MFDADALSFLKRHEINPMILRQETLNPTDVISRGENKMEIKSSKLSFYVGILLLLSLLMGMAIPTQVVRAATITVCASGCDYSTIQDAINGV